MRLVVVARRLYRVGERASVMSRQASGLYGSGLESEDWYLLRDVLIEYTQQKTAAAFTRLPQRLQTGHVGQEIAAYLNTGDHSRRANAIAMMAPGMTNVFLLLEKA